MLSVTELEAKVWEIFAELERNGLKPNLEGCKKTALILFADEIDFERFEWKTI